MDNHLRIGIVGAGRIVRERHLPGLRAIPEVEVVGVVNRTRESTNRAAAELGIPKTYDNWLELVDDLDIDAVVVGTWPYMHCVISIAALDAGKHVLCEARMASNTQEADYMLAAARTNPQLVAQLAPSPFTLGVDKYVRKLIADGFVGDVLTVAVHDSQGFIDRDAPMHWREDFDVSGFNTMTLGIWYEAVMRWVGEAVRVSAMGRTFVPMRRDETGAMRAVRIPDHLDVTAEMACGAQARFHISRVEGFPAENGIWVHGSEGTLAFRDGKLMGGRRGAVMQELRAPDDLRDEWRVERDFVESIRTGAPVKLTTFETGVKYMQFTEAAARSIMENKAIPLPLT